MTADEHTARVVGAGLTAVAARKPTSNLVGS